jgi:hypothetical protein
MWPIFVGLDMAVNLDDGLFLDLGDAVVTAPVKASATWSSGDMLKLDAGYLTVCAAGDIPYGVAVATLATADSPAANGDVDALVYVGGNNHYQYPPDAGSVAITLVGKKCDVGGAASADIDASVDGALLIVGVDVDANKVIVQLANAFAGV